LSFWKWLSSRPTPSAEWVSLVGEDLSYEGDSGGHRVWRFTDGDAVGIFFFSVKPDLPQSHEMARFLSEYEERINTGGALLVECSVLGVRGLPMLRTIVKVPQKPHGMTYLGAFTLPFARLSYVIKTQCEETVITGTREAVLLMDGLRAKTVTIDPESANPIMGSWNPDSAEFDERFPKHPISRLRRHLQEITRCLRLDDRLLAHERFELPNTA
jgi:hypothetical protein